MDLLLWRTASLLPPSSPPPVSGLGGGQSLGEHARSCAIWEVVRWGWEICCGGQTHGEIGNEEEPLVRCRKEEGRFNAFYIQTRKWNCVLR